MGENWDEASAKKVLLHLCEKQPDLFFVVLWDGKVCGAINATVRPWWDGNHITDGELFVDPELQGQGIGKALIRRLFIESKEKYQAVSWDTFTHIVHKHPLKWYKSMGFEEIKEWTMISGNIDHVLKGLE